MTKQVLSSKFLSLITVVFLFLFSSFSDGRNGSNRENTPGTVTFTVKTLTANGTYAPKHVLAIWVEKNGVFVKTRKAMANARKQYLYTWKASSNYNVIDAITGPTLTSHQTHTVEWDCTDVNGNVVPDGEYTMRIEFTDKHAQGPLYSINFAKGTEPVTITPPNQTYFINMQLTYEPDVTAIAEFGANVTETCVGDNVVFTDNSTGATSWNWNFGAGAVPATANTQGPHTVIYSTPSSKTVSLTINGNITETKTNYITVTSNPTAGFTSSVNDLTVTFTNNSQNASTYLWDFGDGNTSTEPNPVHTYVNYGQYQVTLTANSAMCGNDVHTELIVLSETAVAEFVADITQACPQENIVFTDNSTAATSWSWNFGSGAVPPTANTQGPHTVYYTNPGAKTVSLTINGSLTTTKTDYITIFPLPEAGFSYETVSRTVTFTNTSQNAISYLWDFGDGNSSMETNPVHVYAEDGEYEVILVAMSQLCGSDAYLETIVINTVGVDEIGSGVLDVFPNPSTGDFNFTIIQTMQNMKIRLFDVQGKVMFSYEKQNVEAGFVFSTKNLSMEPGMYFMEFVGDNIFVNKKLLVVK